MHNFDYETVPNALLTPEIVSLLGAIREYRGRQELYLHARADVLEAYLNHHDAIEKATVYERTGDVVLYYRGRRADAVQALSR